MRRFGAGEHGVADTYAERLSRATGHALTKAAGDSYGARSSSARRFES